MNAHRVEFTRKAFHLPAAIWPIAWGLGWLTTTHMRWIFGALAVGALVVEAVRRASPAVQQRFIGVFGGLLRSHEPGAITGATWGALSGLVVVWFFPTRSAQVALWAIAVGDGVAALAGVAWKWMRGDPNPGKTNVGSVAALIATAAGAWWLGHASWPIALVIGAVAAAAERPRVALDDNVRVTFATGLAAWGLGLG